MDEVAEVKSRLEVAEVVGGYVQLKQAGRNLKAPCPFHQEKTASFMVSPERGIFHCFGCGEGGDIFKFVMKMEGLEFREALEMLARRAGVELRATRGESRERKAERERLLEATGLAAKYFQMSLVRNPRAIEYVTKQRGLSRKTIEDFQIGYAPDSWEALTSFLTRKGYTPDELLRAGLAGRKEGRSTVYDLFRGRITFTISDREGRPIGFTARVLDDSMPKYLNTPQTPLYDKSTAIFGFHLAREAIRSSDEVVLVEGNMDVVASHQAGVKQVVAASGTALTLEQLRTLSKLTRNVKLAFDADRAGLAATERAIELGQKLGLTIRMITLGEAKDPDELIVRDVKLWEKAIDAAKYVMDYLVERFEDEYDLATALGKRQFGDQLARFVNRLADPIEQGHYIKLISDKTDTTEEAVARKVAGVVEDVPAEAKRAQTKPRFVSADSETIVPGMKVPARQQLEESLLSVCLLYPEARMSLEDLKTEHFSSPERKVLFAELCQQAKSQETSDEVVSGDDMAKSLTELSDYINILLLRGEQEFSDLAPADRSFEGFQLARRLQMIANRDIKQHLSDQLRTAEQSGDGQLVVELLEQYQSILAEEA